MVNMKGLVDEVTITEMVNIAFWWLDSISHNVSENWNIILQVCSLTKDYDQLANQKKIPNRPSFPVLWNFNGFPVYNSHVLNCGEYPPYLCGYLFCALYKDHERYMIYCNLDYRSYL